MTLSEYYVNEFNKAIADARTVKIINRTWFYDGKIYENNDTKEFWKWLFKEIIGCPSDKKLKKLGIERVEEGLENKCIVNKESTSWKAKQLGQTQWYELTNKGIALIVKHYNLKYDRLETK